MQGATTDDEPMGRNPGTSEAANLTALKVRGCDLAPRFADLIEASGHVPCFKAVHMNAPSTRVKSIEKLLAPRAVPHMRLAGDALRERELTSDRHRQKTIDGAPETFTTASKQPLTTGRRPDMTGICANRSLIQVEISPHSWHPARGIHPSFRAAENLGGRLSCSFQWVLQPNSPTRKVLIFIFSGAPPVTC